MIRTSADRLEAKPFGELSEEALRTLRAAITDTLASLGLASVKASALSDRLGLDKTLAWKLTRFMQAGDPLRGAQHLPGSSAMEIVIRACASAGADDGRLESLRSAIDELDALIEDHAGDRSTFDVLIGHHARTDQAEAAARKQLFKAAAGILGVQARAQIVLAVLAPARDDPTRLDVAHASGFIDLQRLRPDLPWIIRRSRYQSTDKGGVFRPDREPLDPDADADGPPLIQALCSPDLPPIHRFPAPDGFQYDELCAGAVGRRGAATCIMGEITRSVASHIPSEENKRGSYTLTVRTPVEFVLFDVVVHREAHHAPPRLSIRSLYEGRPAGAALVPSDVPIEALGSPPTFQTPISGLIPDLAGFIFERTGWDPGAFQGWRLALAHPPAPCDVVLESALV